MTNPATQHRSTNDMKTHLQTRTGYYIEKIPNNYTVTYYINGHCFGKAFYTKKECQDYADNLIKEGII